MIVTPAVSLHHLFSLSEKTNRLTPHMYRIWVFFLPAPGFPRCFSLPDVKFLPANILPPVPLAHILELSHTTTISRRECVAVPRALTNYVRITRPPEQPSVLNCRAGPMSHWTLTLIAAVATAALAKAVFSHAVTATATATHCHTSFSPRRILHLPRPLVHLVQL